MPFVVVIVVIANCLGLVGAISPSAPPFVRTDGGSVRISVLNSSFVYLDKLASNGDVVSSEILVGMDTVQQMIDARVNLLQNRVASLELQLSTAVSSEASTANQLTSETNRAVNTDASLATSVANEASRTVGVDTSLASSVSNEISRAVGVDTSLATSVANEASRVVGVDASLATSVSNEMSRASGTEAALVTSIAQEASRAVGAEGALLSVSLAAEVSRSVGREQSLYTALNTALSASVQTVTNTDASLATQLSRSQASVVVETSRAVAAETSIATNLSAVTRCLNEGKFIDAKGNCVVMGMCVCPPVVNGSAGCVGSVPTATTANPSCSSGYNLTSLLRPVCQGDGLWSLPFPACADINECLVGNGNCSANAICTNTPGSRTCACSPGYSGDGFTCTNTNACTTNPCGANTACADLPPPSEGFSGRTCTCLAGFENTAGTLQSNPAGACTVVPLGRIDRPASSCAAILSGGFSTGNGLYYLTGSTPAVFCDMTNGGWALVAKFAAFGTSWMYGNAIWTDNTVLNTGALADTTTVASAKSALWSSYAASQIRIDVTGAAPGTGSFVTVNNAATQTMVSLFNMQGATLTTTAGALTSFPAKDPGFQGNTGTPSNVVRVTLYADFGFSWPSCNSVRSRVRFGGANGCQSCGTGDGGVNAGFTGLGGSTTFRDAHFSDCTNYGQQPDSYFETSGANTNFWVR